jgi:hypothetical protein
LTISDQREQDCCTVDRLAEQHLAMIEQKIADLSELKDRLSRLLGSCQGGRVAECRVIDALMPSASIVVESGAATTTGTLA